ncbi:5-oxoprolinase subunit PxpB [Paenibacillus sp. P25]|nr:5-oxoprolinase subunit PxpB [Paenibacillus sp. P25]
MPHIQTKEATNDLHIAPLGDRAVVVQFGSGIDRVTHGKVQALCSRLEQCPFPGMIEIVPAFASVTIYYDPMLLSGPSARRYGRSGGGSAFDKVSALLESMVSELGPEAHGSSRVVRIPVCYGGELGPDLAEVARHNGLSEEEVIEIHSSQDYLVYMIGFAPGFPYLGGMSEKIVTPRRSSPRLAIPTGSVGIGGNQTGVYPISTPGGWQLIGRTPVAVIPPGS